ncbi:hypothetical protein AZ09_10400 [Acetobacter aceti 1023]|nr:hypothetical protein AZ09_10400 [Acetobacter aceti 1023]
MIETIEDKQGRKITVEEVAGSKLARLTRLVGDAWGQNAYTTGTLARASVKSVAGVPVPTPTNLNEVDGLWDEVDPDAAGAALEWMIAKQKSVMDEAKNSSAPPDSETAAGS